MVYVPNSRGPLTQLILSLGSWVLVLWGEGEVASGTVARLLWV